jgi:hypothetical protein
VKRSFVVFLFAMLLAAAASRPGFAASPSPSPDPSASPTEAQLQAESENPLANLTSIPFQYNANFNYGTYRLDKQVLNIEPVIPVQLGDDQAWFNRIIMPVETLPAEPGAPAVSGLGDINPQFYFAPAQSKKLIYGFGPTFFFPTGSGALGSGKWDAGLDAAIVSNPPGVVYGFLSYNVWSIAGDPTRKPVNKGQYQLWGSWTLPHGFTVGFKSETDVDWNEAGDNKWTVPFGPTFSQILRLGDTRGKIGMAFYWNVVHPVLQGPTWSAQGTFTLLYPH